jgi:hypothetical protein
MLFTYCLHLRSATARRAPSSMKATLEAMRTRNHVSSMAPTTPRLDSSMNSTPAEPEPSQCGLQGGRKWSPLRSSTGRLWLLEPSSSSDSCRKCGSGGGGICRMVSGGGASTPQPAHPVQLKGHSAVPSNVDTIALQINQNLQFN